MGGADTRDASNLASEPRAFGSLGMALEPNTAQGEVTGADDGNAVDITVARSIGLTVARHTSGLRVMRSFGDTVFGPKARHQALFSSPLTTVESRR